MYIFNHYFRTYFGVPITNNYAQQFENRPKVIQRLLDSRIKYQQANADYIKSFKALMAAPRKTEKEIEDYISLQDDLNSNRETAAMFKEGFDHDLLAAYYAGYKAEALAMK